MEATTRSHESLYIPVNIKTRFEFFDGYGISELIYTAISTLVSGIIAFTIHSTTGNTTLAVLIVLITIATSIGALAKDHSNQSVLDQLRFMMRFMRKQRKFQYYYTDEWSD